MSDENTKSENEELFNNIKSIISILEFNSTYPESRKILNSKR